MRVLSSPVSNVENLGVVLLPSKISPYLLRDVRFASGRETDHYHNKFGCDVSIGNSSIWRDEGARHSRNTESRRMWPHSGSLAAGVLAHRGSREIQVSYTEGWKTTLDYTHMRGDPGAVEDMLLA